MGNDLFLWTDRNNDQHPLSNLQSNTCDYKNPDKFTDIATIDDMELLPIVSISYGPVTYEFQVSVIFCEYNEYILKLLNHIKGLFRMFTKQKKTFFRFRTFGQIIFLSNLL